MVENWLSRFLNGRRAQDLTAKALRRVSERVNKENVGQETTERIKGEEARLREGVANAGRQKKLALDKEEGFNKKLHDEMRPHVLNNFNQLVLNLGDKLNEASLGAFKSLTPTRLFTFPRPTRVDMSKYQTAPERVYSTPLESGNRDSSYYFNFFGSDGIRICKEILNNEVNYREFRSFCQDQGYSVEIFMKTHSKYASHDGWSANWYEVEGIDMELSWKKEKTKKRN